MRESGWDALSSALAVMQGTPPISLSVPWAIVVVMLSAVTGSLSAYWGLRLKVQKQGAASMRAEAQIRQEIATLRGDMERRHAENQRVQDRIEQRGRFSLRLTADIARRLKVDGIEEEVIDHFTQDDGDP